MYNPILHGVGRLGVLRVTGPIAYTLAITPLLHFHQHRFVDSQSEMGFEYSIFPASKALPHKELFKNHYTYLSDPVINSKPTNFVLTLIFRMLSKIPGIRRGTRNFFRSQKGQ